MPNGGLAAEIRHTEGRNTMRRLLRDHGLSIAMFGLFFVFVCGQSVMDLLDYNSTQQEHGRQPVGYVQYLGSGDFIEAVFENWESEFLQMGLYVVLTALLYQRGSAESKDPDSQHPDEAGYEEAKHRADAPWPIRKGGLALKLYENSLSIVLLSLFVFSFVSFQNWQSESLAIGAMIVLSIYLRQRGSSQSKPVSSPHSPHGETGG